MKIDTIRENAEPFGTEYSCMMMIIVKGKLVFVPVGTREFEGVEKIILSSEKFAPKGIPKEASGEDLLAFFNMLRGKGPTKA